MINLFEKLTDYNDYLMKHPFHTDIGLEININKKLNEKVIYDPYFAVNPKNSVPFQEEMDDLIRLHYLIVNRKVTTIMELGVGKSTAVFDHALELNKKNHEKFVTSELRRSNSFQCHSIDNSEEWINITKKSYPFKNTTLHYSGCNISTFNDRVCSFYEHLPNICPDFIYIDGPDQFSVDGEVRGISTRHLDRTPMSADILPIEHFLLPGTLIVIDGRTANARFLKANLQRNWQYYFSEEFDQHFFELNEEPLGPYNKKQLAFSLGKL